MVGAGLAITYLLPRVTKALPSPLVAIVALAGVSIALGLPVRTVGDMGRLPEGLPSLALPHVPLTLETLRIILPFSLTMAAVGLLESLMTAQIVDDMSDTDSDKRRECAGQGAPNIAAAFVGGMGGCAMIGQSVINVTSGGRKRLSTFTAGAFLMFLLAVLRPRTSGTSAVAALDKVIARLRRDSSDVEVIGYNKASADLVDRFALHEKTGFELGAVPH